MSINKTRKSEAGFNLVEVVVALAVIAIVAAVGLNFYNPFSDAKGVACSDALRQIYTATASTSHFLGWTQKSDIVNDEIRRV